MIPKGTYIVGPVDFAGPCKAKTIHFKVDGTVQSSKKQSVTGGAHPNAWISFTQVNNLFISGDGIFDGQGFEGNCTKAKQCEQPPLVRIPILNNFDFFVCLFNNYLSYMSFELRTSSNKMKTEVMICSIGIN